MDKTYVFIDESGDPGFKLEAGASANFVISCVIFNKADAIEGATLKMNELRILMKKKEGYEFKFNKMSKKERLQAMRVMRGLGFSFKAICVRKEDVKSQEIISQKSKLFNYLIKIVIKRSGLDFSNSIIIIDGKIDRIFKKEFTSQVRKIVKTNKKKNIKIKLRDSGGSLPIQLADLIAGAVNCFYTKRTDSKIYLTVVKRQKDKVWLLK
jgi:hypothetical protein